MNYEQEADKLVEMFTKIIWDSGNTVSRPMILDVCMAHCKQVIGVLELSSVGACIASQQHHYQTCRGLPFVAAFTRYSLIVNSQLKLYSYVRTK